MKKVSDLRIPFTWQNRQPVLLEKFFYLPGHYDHSAAKAFIWEDPAIFDNTRPVVIEYCSGNGQWICEQAKKTPHLNWVAVEKRFDRARKIWVRLHKEGLSNLLVVCGEGLLFTRHYVPASSISQIFVNFPDPWPKLRHAKHRLIRDEFLKEVEKKLCPKAQAMFTTDDRPYVDQILETVAQHSNWKSLEVATEHSDFGASFFLDLWKSKGRTIYHLYFEVSP